MLAIAKADILPCGVLDDVTGDVTVMDPFRTAVPQVTKTPIACGGWVSVNDGWARIRYHRGPVILIAKNSFLQIGQEKKTSPLAQEDIVLYKGDISIESRTNWEEFRVVTPSARMRFHQGKVLVLFQPDAKKTQLVSLDGTASIENRFEGKNHVAVHPGEASDLNLHVVRVVPTAPQPVSIASMKARFFDLHYTQKEENEAVLIIQKRQRKKFLLTKKNKIPENARVPASVKPVQNADEEDMLHGYWINKMVGDYRLNKDIAQEKTVNSQSKTFIRVVDQDANKPYVNKKEAAEKQKLIEQLSQLKADEH